MVYCVLLYFVLLFNVTHAMIKPTTARTTTYQPSVRVWEQPAESYQPSLYQETSPRYFGTSTAPRTLFTQPSTQPTLQRAAFARWQQQTPRTLLQQPTTRTQLGTPTPFAQPAARTFASPTEPSSEKKSWAEWIKDLWNPQPKPSMPATYALQDLTTNLKNISRYTQSYIKQSPKVIDPVLKDIDEFPQEYVNVPAVSHPMYQISNLTLLKAVIANSKPLEPTEQYTLVKRVLDKGANPNYNPHYTRKIKWYYGRDFEIYQYPPIWIAILRSNSGALKALLEAGVKITNDNIASINNVYQLQEKWYTTILDIAQKNNDPQILNLLKEYGYLPGETTKEQPRREQPTEEPKKEAPKAEPAYSQADKKINTVNVILNDITTRPEIQEYAIPQLLKSIDQFPQEYINDVYTWHGFTAENGQYPFDDKRFIDPILSNETVLKLTIDKTNKIPTEQQYILTKKLLTKGANPTYNPHYTTIQAINLLSQRPFNQQYQYSPVWIAVMKSNAGALKALLEAGVKITDETAQQVSKMTDTPQANLTLLEIAQKNNNPETLSILEQFGYIPRRKQTSQEPPRQTKSERQQIELSTDELVDLGLDGMYAFVTTPNRSSYAILGLNRKEKINKNMVDSARKKLAKAYFPDKFPIPEDNYKATIVMQSVMPAYDDVLAQENLNID